MFLWLLWVSAGLSVLRVCFLWRCFLCLFCVLRCWAIVFVAGVGFRFLLLSCGCGFCDVVSCVVVLRCDCLFVCCV